MAFRMVIDYEGGSWQPDVDGTFSQDAFAYHVSISCNHCNNPVCTRVCPTGAMHKDDNGIVSVDAHRCIGCGYCALSCPYRAPKVDREAGHSAKCDGCTDRVAAGLEPVCVEACPMRAIEFGEMGDLRAAHPDAVSELPCTEPAATTTPNILIGASRGALLEDFNPVVL